MDGIKNKHERLSELSVDTLERVLAKMKAILEQKKNRSADGEQTTTLTSPLDEDTFEFACVRPENGEVLPSVEANAPEDDGQVSAPVLEMLVSETTEDEDEPIDPGIPVIEINKLRDELTLRDFSKHRVTEIYEIIDLEQSVSGFAACFRMHMTYKSTECELICDHDTTFLVKDGDAHCKAIIRREDKYLKCKDDSPRVPLFCLCVISDVYLGLFEDVTYEKEKVDAIRVFSRLSEMQRDFVASMYNRPRYDDAACEVVADSFTPIRDEKALKMLYKLCKNTYKPSVRARVDDLFDQLTRAHGTDRADILNQIAFTIGINTAPLGQTNRTYDEIIAILDKHIYGMRALKESIAEFIISMQFSGDPYCSILLVGPPGVGKTSISDAIVECLGVPLIHIDCSGVNTITMSGLIKSYGSAKAGKVMDAFLEMGRTDVVLLLDEIDKMEKGKEGDPYGALIKPLGPQRKYYDEYVAADTDVSATKFIATANDISKIPGYILNRFEGNVFVIDPYSVEEKAEIARNHILPKKLAAFNLSADDIVFDDAALLAIARDYCSDAGAREISGHLTTLIRKIITQWSRGITPRPLCVDEAYVHAHITRSRALTDGGSAKMRIGF